MPITRVFLGWDRPFLHSLASYCFEHFVEDGELRLHGKTFCFPVSRAGRRFIEILVERAGQEGLRLLPPSTITSGMLPEFLVRNLRPHAPFFVRMHSWIDALETLPDTSRNLLVSEEAAQEIELLSFAEQMESLYRELAGAQICAGDVSVAAGECGSELSQKRWEVISELFSSYESLLQEQGYFDRYKQRRDLLSSLDVCWNTTSDIFLAGVADLNQSSKSIVAKFPCEVLSFVFAPEDEATHFDETGSLLAEYWAERALPLTQDQCHRAEDASHQAESVYQYVASVGERTVEEITFGLTDEALAPYVEERFTVDGVVCRHSSGKALQESRPVKLVQAALRYLDSRQYQDFTQFVRHVDVQRALTQCETHEGIPKDILSFLDSYHNVHLPSVLQQPFVGNDQEKKSFGALYDAVHHLLGELTGAKRSLLRWQEPLLTFLRNIYSNCVFHDHSLHDRMVVEACQKVKNQFLTFESQALHRFENLSASQALKLLLRGIRREIVSPEPKEEAIEMLGWLELPLDDAPIVAVIGCAEGHLPESVNSDPFLPNTLRAKLGLLDNRMRAARDTYALTTLLHSRESVHLFYAATHPRGEFLPPSRLFFQVDQSLLADRALQLYLEQQVPKTLSSLERKSAGELSHLSIPRPQKSEQPLERMSVTSFRSYLRCPYRFYLQHVRKLQKLDDTALELDAPAFGNLVHDVLKGFFTSQARASTEEEVIREALLAELTRLSNKLFGSFPLPAVLVQIEQVKHRLRQFASWQAEWRATGWLMEHAEYDIGDEECYLEHEAGRTMLSGRIDRIDRNEKTGDIAVFDYKTGEKGQDLFQACSKDGLEWYDLQLPLYEHALRQKGYSEEIQLGHITLARSEKNIGHHFADWSLEHREAAIQTARDVAAAVYRQEFWPPTDDIFAFDDFAAICGMEQYQHDDWQEA